MKGGNVTRVTALVIAIVIAFFCTLEQSGGVNIKSLRETAWYRFRHILIRENDLR